MNFRKLLKKFHVLFKHFFKVEFVFGHAINLDDMRRIVKTRDISFKLFKLKINNLFIVREGVCGL